MHHNIRHGTEAVIAVWASIYKYIQNYQIIKPKIHKLLSIYMYKVMTSYRPPTFLGLGLGGGGNIGCNTIICVTRVMMSKD